MDFYYSFPISLSLHVFVCHGVFGAFFRGVCVMMVIVHKKSIFLVTFSCLFFIKHCYLIILVFSNVQISIIKKRKEPKRSPQVKKPKAHQAQVKTEIILSRVKDKGENLNLKFRFINNSFSKLSKNKIF